MNNYFAIISREIKSLKDLYTRYTANKCCPYIGILIIIIPGSWFKVSRVKKIGERNDIMNCWEVIFSQ